MPRSRKIWRPNLESKDSRHSNTSPEMQMSHQITREEELKTPSFNGCAHDR